MRSCWVRSPFKLLVLALAALAGCARVEPRKPVQIEDQRAYLLTEAPEQFDVTAVAGRRIVLDPGHGGPWPGAVGPNGLREADVNLGVALQLWGLLTEAGADVTLTRTSDSAVARKPHPTLKEDLQARADLATATHADLFISLHHNADIIPGSRKNDLETYYQLRDPGPSLDAAQAIHRHLARNTGERPNAILPGNFHVIRETAVPGLLGEASYVSSEDNAQHLAFAAAQRLEAEAYFLGIVEYFSRGVPQVAETYPGPDDRVGEVPTLHAVFRTDRHVPIDPGTISLELDGAPVPVIYNPAARRATAALREPLANGPHRLRVVARNVRGNATPTRRVTFTVDRPPAALTLELQPRRLNPDSDGAVLVSARVRDAHGLPVHDGTMVQFRCAAGTLDLGAAPTRGGVATTAWHAAGAECPGITARCGSALEATADVPTATDAPLTRLVRVVDGDTGAPIREALVRIGDAQVPVRGDGLALVHADATDTLTVRAAGYWPAVAPVAPLATMPPQDVPLHAVAGGALRGKVITIDPADGGAESGARGPTGLRAADVNLRVARYLADYIASAGGRAVLTRTGDATTSPFERVELSEDAGADRFITIRHGAAGRPERVLDESGHATTADLSRGVVVEHYPTSADGKRLAGEVQAELRGLFPDERPRVMQSVAYELTHTGCPAIRVQALTPVDPADELLLSAPATQRRVAYAVFTALARDFGADPDALAGLAGTVRRPDGSPVVNATVRVNDLWVAVTDGRGAFRFALLPPGPVRLDVSPDATTTVTQRLELKPGADRTLMLTVDAPAPRAG